MLSDIAFILFAIKDVNVVILHFNLPASPCVTNHSLHYTR
jgi:hypothetical protein